MHKHDTLQIFNRITSVGRVGDLNMKGKALFLKVGGSIWFIILFFIPFCVKGSQCGDHKYKYTGQVKTPAALMLSKWVVVTRVTASDICVKGGISQKYFYFLPDTLCSPLQPNPIQTHLS